MQVASLMQKFETIIDENQQLKQELEKVKKIHKEEVNQMKQELNEVKRTNDHLKKDVQKMCDKLKNAVRTDIDEQIAIQKSEFNDLLETKCVSLQTHTMPLPVPPFYFSMANLNQYQSNGLEYSSESFYSHPGGYKMKVCVFPNGFSDSKGTHMEIFVGIVRGEFDDHLRWPLNGRITVQAYNRTTNQWSNEYTIVLNEKVCDPKYVKRCVDVLEHGCIGTSQFLSLLELKNDYVKATNIVRFRITRVEICN